MRVPSDKGERDTDMNVRVPFSCGGDLTAKRRPVLGDGDDEVVEHLTSQVHHRGLVHQLLAHGNNNEKKVRAKNEGSHTYIHRHTGKKKRNRWKQTSAKKGRVG